MSKIKKQRGFAVWKKLGGQLGGCKLILSGNITTDGVKMSCSRCSGIGVGS